MPCYGTGSEPLAVAHRGGAGLAPANTMAALAGSWALGVGHLEVDVRRTADGVPVLVHDAHVRPAAGPPRRVDRLTLGQLRTLVLPGGHVVPTLAQALLAFPDACVMVDVKDSEVVPVVLDTLSELDAVERVCLTGGWDAWLARARAELGVTTALGWRGMAVVLASGRLAPLRRHVWRTGASYAHVPLRLGGVPTYARALVPRAHDLGLRLLVWGVETSTAMHRLLDDGVDGIITDRPDLLREVLVARGQWVPAAGLRREAAPSR